MTAYYNENDPYCAQWLRNLINAGHIAPGEVDERSIVDIRPGDLAGYTQCHFFAGIGVWSHAMRRAGWSDDTPVWTGSCPCQPFSAAGKGGGFADERHLWPAWFHLISQCCPEHIYGEQVASEAGLEWLDRVCADLEGAGYAGGAIDLCAAGIGAPHIRQRLYWMGNTINPRLEGHAGNGAAAGQAQATGPDAEAGGGSVVAARVDAVSMLRRVDLHNPRGARSGLQVQADRQVEPRPLWSEFEALACSDGWRRVRSGTFPMVTGATSRVGRLRAYGNSINAEVAKALIEASMTTG